MMSSGNTGSPCTFDFFEAISSFDDTISVSGNRFWLIDSGCLFGHLDPVLFKFESELSDTDKLSRECDENEDDDEAVCGVHTESCKSSWELESRLSRTEILSELDNSEASVQEVDGIGSLGKEGGARELGSVLGGPFCESALFQAADCIFMRSKLDRSK